MNRPPKLLKGSLDITSAISSSSWNATINAIISQPHPAYVDPNSGRTYYDGRDVVEGDYITTTASGKCLRITNITAKTDVSFNCVLVDDDELNRSIDTNADGRILEGEGYIFEVKNNVPVVFPLPSGLAAGFTFTFASQLLARFLAKSGVGSIPQGVLTEEDLGSLVATLTSGKVPIAQLPVGVNPTTQVAPGGEYLLATSRGSSVAPLEGGKIPVEFIPSVQDQFITVTTYNDLLQIVSPDVNIYYIVTNENAIYKWTGTVFIKVSGESVETSYSYISVSTSNSVYSASNKQVISIIGDNITVLLPINPENGNEIIILNSGTGTIIDPNGNTIRNSTEIYNLPDNAYSTYLVYVNGWQFSESNQLVNIYTQQPGADQFGPSDYWPAGTKQTMVNSTIYEKDAYIETWESTRNQTVTVLSYVSPYASKTIQGTTTSTEGWVAKNVELNIEGDKITISGATAGATGYGTYLNGTWEIIYLYPNGTDFQFLINDTIPIATPMTTGIGNTVRIVKEKLAEQVTIFETGSDNFRSIWFPKSGNALERYVTFDSNLMPSVRYANNLVLSISKLLNINWKNYETFTNLVSSDANFMNILSRQDILNNIASNTDFINEFISSRSDLHYENPIMTGNTAPANFTVAGSSVSGTSNYYYAFDGSLDSQWESATNSITDQYLTLTLPSNITIFPYSFTIYTKAINYSPKNIRLEHSSNGINWNIAGEYVLSNDTLEDTFFIFKQGITSRYWRFYFVDCYSTEKMVVNNIKIRGWNTYGK